MGALLAVVDRAGADMFRVEEYLSRAAIAAAPPAAPAPPAAGGAL